MSKEEQIRAQVAMYLEELYENMYEDEGHFVLADEPRLIASVLPSGFDIPDMPHFYLAFMSAVVENIPDSSFTHRLINQLNIEINVSKVLAYQNEGTLDIVVCTTLAADDLQAKEITAGVLLTQVYGQKLPERIYRSIATQTL